jgi:hypothetical protein
VALAGHVPDLGDRRRGPEGSLKSDFKLAKGRDQRT